MYTYFIVDFIIIYQIHLVLMCCMIVSFNLCVCNRNVVHIHRLKIGNKHEIHKIIVQKISYFYILLTSRRSNFSLVICIATATTVVLQRIID